MTKVCLKCREEKPHDEFWRAKRLADGRQQWCKPCMREYRRGWDRGRPRGDRTDESFKARLRKYKLTVDEYVAMLAGQAHRCAACRSEFESTPHIDHCHTTGKVRGLLCRKCNRALGLARDDRQVLLNLVAYLDASH